MRDWRKLLLSVHEFEDLKILHVFTDIDNTPQPADAKLFTGFVLHKELFREVKRV